MDSSSVVDNVAIVDGTVVVDNGVGGPSVVVIADVVDASSDNVAVVVDGTVVVDNGVGGTFEVVVATVLDTLSVVVDIFVVGNVVGDVVVDLAVVDGSLVVVADFLYASFVACNAAGNFVVAGDVGVDLVAANVEDTSSLVDNVAVVVDNVVGDVGVDLVVVDGPFVVDADVLDVVVDIEVVGNAVVLVLVMAGNFVDGNVVVAAVNVGVVDNEDSLEDIGLVSSSSNIVGLIPIKPT